MFTGTPITFTSPDPAQVGASTGMKIAAVVSGLVLLGVGQSGKLERNWLAKLSGAGLLGAGIYWLFAPPQA